MSEDLKARLSKYVVYRKPGNVDFTVVERDSIPCGVSESGKIALPASYPSYTRYYHATGRFIVTPDGNVAEVYSPQSSPKIYRDPEAGYRLYEAIRKTVYKFMSGVTFHSASLGDLELWLGRTQCEIFVSELLCSEREYKNLTPAQRATLQAGRVDGIKYCGCFVRASAAESMLRVGISVKGDDVGEYHSGFGKSMFDNHK